jgi:DNA helicase-2/ATP-dependent DNA helicase PcrA
VEEIDRLLDPLNEAQREAVQAVSGPVVILAGAGSGKTRVISHRAAYAIETGAVEASQVLLVTFTDKAAGEMVGRMASLGHRAVMARTFHAMALAQLRHFWPSRHDGEAPPEILASKTRLIVPLVRRLPGGYAFTPSKDVAAAIEWAKVRRIPPARWVADGGTHAPLPPDLFARLYGDYERSKRAAGLLDFEDLLVETVVLLESDADAAAVVRARKRWISVDEYQDTNPLAERLLELWLGDSRDLAVVGDPDQTIYTFTGASPEFLLTFADRHPGARTVALVDNYRSTPQVLRLANRLVGDGPRGALRATRPDGPTPTVRRYADDDAERASLAAGIARLVASGVDVSEMAVLVRINAQIPPIEEVLTRAGIGYQVDGARFFARPEVADARRRLARLRLTATGAGLVAGVRGHFVKDLGMGADAAGSGPEARERDASFELLLSILEDLVAADPDVGLVAYLAGLERRATAEAGSGAAGVHLLTYHRAKGLEWDAVFLPALEEGVLPIRHAKEDDEIAEERRLLYVGITRARTHLALSWAARRTARDGKEGARRPSRFLAALEERRPAAATTARGSSATGRTGASAQPRAARSRSDSAASPLDVADVDRHLLEALQLWRRERARVDAVPAYVVAHDATLAAIAAERPRSRAALEQVKGMGPVKVERYADEILAVVARSDA